MIKLTIVKVAGKFFTGQTIEIKNNELIVDGKVSFKITDKDTVIVVQEELKTDNFEF